MNHERSSRAHPAMLPTRQELVRWPGGGGGAHALQPAARAAMHAVQADAPHLVFGIVLGLPHSSVEQAKLPLGPIDTLLLMVQAQLARLDLAGLQLKRVNESNITVRAVEAR